MRILVISDIHSNLNKSIFDHASSSDLVLCLGDLIDLGEVNEECFDFMLELSSLANLEMVPGNCDTNCLQEFLDEHPNISIQKSVKEFNGYSFAGFGGTVDAITHARLSRSHFLSKSETLFDSISTHLKNSKWLVEFLDTIGILIEDQRLSVIPERSDLIMKYRNLSSPCEFQETEINDFFMKNAINSSIWVLHTPPYGFPGSERLGGLSIGSRGVLDAITALQPLLTVSGHIHQAGKWQLGRTVCLSAPAMKDNLALLVTIHTDETISHEIIKLE